MRNTLLILSRELRLRLRRPSFWLLAIIVPALLAATYAIPVVSATRNAEPSKVLVVDETGLFAGRMASDEMVHYHVVPTLEDASRQLAEADAMLVIPLRQTTIPRDAFLYYRDKEPSPAVQSRIDSRLQTLLQNAIAEDVYGLSPDAYRSLEATHISLHTRAEGTTHDSHLGTRTTVATVLAALMALAIMLFSVLTMKSLQSERQGRVAELLLTSASPSQLLWGKVGGVAAGAVIELALWVGLTTAAIAGIQASEPDLFAAAKVQQQTLAVATKGTEATVLYNTPASVVNDTMQGLAAINLPLTAALFVLFFLLGLAFYGLLMAAIGSRLDADADATQWSLLVCSPLLLAAAATPLTGPHPVLLILCPLTAPVSTMATLPFGIGTWQVLLAAILLVISAVAAGILASRTYRKHIVG